VHDETGVYPLLRRVRYKHADLAFEISVVLSYMGEEYVATTLVSGDRSGPVRRTQIGSNTAHTGYRMRRALMGTGRQIRCGNYSGSNCRAAETEHAPRQMWILAPLMPGVP